jgi:hypothetical protein
VHDRILGVNSPLVMHQLVRERRPPLVLMSVPLNLDLVTSQSAAGAGWQMVNEPSVEMLARSRISPRVVGRHEMEPRRRV